MENLNDRLYELLNKLESSDLKEIEEAAYEIGGMLIVESKRGEKVLDSKMEEIENLSLELELPKGQVSNYEGKLEKLRVLIRSLKSE